MMTIKDLLAKTLVREQKIGLLFVTEEFDGQI